MISKDPELANCPLFCAAAALGHAQDSSLYQCQPSSQNSEQVFIPNIPDSYFDHANLAGLRVGSGAILFGIGQPGVTLIFTVPALSADRNCSGTVVSAEFCYEATVAQVNASEVLNVFDFITLRRDDLNFTVLTRTDVTTTPQDSLCTDPPGDFGPQRVCCTTETFSAQVPSESFMFGVVINSRSNRMLVFNNISTDSMLRGSGLDSWETLDQCLEKLYQALFTEIAHWFYYVFS